jgi:hypothetical protein
MRYKLPKQLATLPLQQVNATAPPSIPIHAMSLGVE